MSYTSNPTADVKRPHTIHTPTDQQKFPSYPPYIKRFLPIVMTKLENKPPIRSCTRCGKYDHVERECRHNIKVPKCKICDRSGGVCCCVEQKSGGCDTRK